MKLYGSVNNRMMERALSTVPEVGMGATLISWSDRDPYSIVEVSDRKVHVEVETSDSGLIKRSYPRIIKVTRDKAKIINGESVLGSPEYEFYKDPNAKVETFVYHRKSNSYRRETKKFKVVDGEYIEYGTGTTKREAPVLLVGVRDKYYDPHF